MIKRYVALVDPLKVGLQLLAYVSVKLEKMGRMPVEEFSSAVNSWTEVIECYSMTGEMGYLLRVQVEDLVISRASSWASCSSSPAWST